MKRQLLTLLASTLLSLPALAEKGDVFEYEYEGQTLYYTILDEEAKTCETKADSSLITAGNPNVSIPNLVIPEIANGYKVVGIGYMSFYDAKFSQLELPGSITTIGEYAFSGCRYLTSVMLPSSLTTFDANAFYNCSNLTSIEVDSDNQNFATVDGVLYDKNISTIVCYPNGRTDVEFSVPATVTTIGNRAFTTCRKLKSIILPNSVTTIGDGAFSYCSGLTSITIPNSVTTIGNYAFDGCSGLTSITLPNSVTTIGNNVFSFCSGLTSITLPNTVTTIGDGAFNYCSGLTSITIPNSVTTIGDYAFSGCSGLASITLPNSVTTISNYALAGCSSLTSITLPNSVTTIGNYAFSGCSKLESVTLSNSLTAIGVGAFYNCVGLASITLPASLETIGALAFAGCTGLEINVDSNHPNFTTIDGVLFNKEVTTLILYLSNKKATEYSIPASITTIGTSAFYGCSGLTSISMPNSVTSIGERAFYGCTGLTSINLSNKLEAIGAYVFNGCSGLTSISIPNSVTTIGENAFSGCTGLSSVSIPNSVTTIGELAFWRTGLTSINIPSSVAEIGAGALSGCGSLSEITVDSENKCFMTVDGILFNKEMTTLVCCPAKKEIERYIVPLSVTTIGGSAFNGCSSLETIVLGSKITEIGDFAFQYTNAFIWIIMAQTPPIVGSNTFPSDPQNRWRKVNVYVPSDREIVEAYRESWPYSRVSISGFSDTPSELKVDVTEISGNPGDKIQINAQLVTEEEIWSEDMWFPQLYWTSTNPEIASVDNNGLVTIHQKKGGCKIIVESLYAGFSAEIEVNPGEDSIDEVKTEAGMVEVYDLNGRRVGGSLEGLQRGIYIVRQGAASKKVAIK